MAFFFGCFTKEQNSLELPEFLLNYSHKKNSNYKPVRL
jgi:hypothetical protein